MARSRRLRNVALVVPLVTLVLCPRVLREFEIHGRDARISPDKKAYALRVGPDALRIDYLPCGDFLAPRPDDFPVPIRDFGWRDTQTLWILPERPVPKSLTFLRTISGVRLLILEP